jgi:hypothetical protein
MRTSHDDELRTRVRERMVCVLEASLARSHSAWAGLGGLMTARAAPSRLFSTTVPWRTHGILPKVA